MAQSNVTEVERVTFTRSPAGMVWRWRSETGLLLSGGAGFLECAHCAGLVPAAVAFGGPALVAGVLPWSRRFLVRRFWCLFSRHRLQSVWWQLRLHNRSGRLPLVAWIRPTPVGERAWVLCRAGLCADDFTKTAGEMAAACGAREVRVTKSRKVETLVTIDVIRRDPLAPGKVVASRLADDEIVPAVAEWLPPELDGEPVVPAGGWPHITPGGDWP